MNDTSLPAHAQRQLAARLRRVASEPAPPLGAASPEPHSRAVRRPPRSPGLVAEPGCRRAPRPLAAIGRLGALDEAEASELPHVPAAARRRLANRFGALARRARAHRQQVIEECDPGRVRGGRAAPARSATRTIFSRLSGRAMESPISERNPSGSMIQSPDAIAPSNCTQQTVSSALAGTLHLPDGEPRATVLMVPGSGGRRPRQRRLLPGDPSRPARSAASPPRRSTSAASVSRRATGVTPARLSRRRMSRRSSPAYGRRS